jgi:hypothetical protein
MANYTIRAIFTLLFFFTATTLTFAASADSTGVSTDSSRVDSGETNSEIEMADLLRSNGMIYVVVGVILIVLIGLILYLINIDRKLKKLEKEVDEKQGN